MEITFIILAFIGAFACGFFVCFTFALLITKPNHIRHTMKGKGKHE